MMLPRCGTLLTYGRALVTRTLRLSFSGKLRRQTKKKQTSNVAPNYNTEHRPICWMLDLKHFRFLFNIEIKGMTVKHDKFTFLYTHTHMGCCLSFSTGPVLKPLLQVRAAASISSSETTRSPSSH